MASPGKLNRRAAFFDQLAAMIAAGVSLPKAIEMASRNRSIGVPRQFLEALSRQLNEGHTFADAMQLVSGQVRRTDGTRVNPQKALWLSNFDIALLSAGEESGRLDSMFKVLGRYYAARARILRDTYKDLIVPMVTLHVGLMVFPISFLQMFALGFVNNQYAMCLPFIVEKAVVYGLLWGLIFMIVYSSEENRAEGFRGFLESVYLCIPWLGKSFRYMAIARLSMALDSLLDAGVPVVRAWEMAAISCGSPALKREILRLTPELETGSTQSEMIAKIRYFPEMFTQLYQSGEISGKQGEMLTKLHTYFEEEGFNALRIFSKVFTYLIYFGIAIAMAIAIISFWLHYYGALFGGV